MLYGSSLEGGGDLIRRTKGGGDDAVAAQHSLTKLRREYVNPYDAARTTDMSVKLSRTGQYVTEFDTITQELMTKFKAYYKYQSFKNINTTNEKHMIRLRLRLHRERVQEDWIVADASPNVYHLIPKPFPKRCIKCKLLHKGNVQKCEVCREMAEANRIKNKKK